ncbi:MULTISPECIES: hypothetical protein [unclassified Spirosoma]|uniref:hypothetical protein n=1 Tax=unclassified Spirosoma TaxID=2621999 RepID=UPI000962AA18|nr:MULTISPECIES: hypothetical protein [unclassified Spirosoma]MBN8826461.1 hypothetical protein [Spirosoma sp.]OJW76446.1 MAG: hypothetical protein BGO59_23315 [Spirosoma sp. 48-14]
MILQFKIKTDDGKPTGFVRKILTGQKIHTLREDVTGRWKPGAKIQFATGVRTPKYEQFLEGICTGIQKVFLRTDNVNVFIYVDGRLLTGADVVRFYRNDGFKTFDEFSSWFMPICQSAQATGKKGVALRLIHWTDFKY